MFGSSRVLIQTGKHSPQIYPGLILLLQNFEKQGIVVPQINYADFDRLIGGNTDIVEQYHTDYGNLSTIVMDNFFMGRSWQSARRHRDCDSWH